MTSRAAGRLPQVDVPWSASPLSIFFTATGRETTPQACAFDGISCG